MELDLQATQRRERAGRECGSCGGASITETRRKRARAHIIMRRRVCQTLPIVRAVVGFVNRKGSQSLQRAECSGGGAAGVARALLLVYKRGGRDGGAARAPSASARAKPPGTFCGQRSNG